MIILEDDQQIIDKAIYLPLLIIILNRDLDAVEKTLFKFKSPYLMLIEETLKKVQNDLAEVKRHMYKNKIKVERLESERGFTKYYILCRGYEDKTVFNNAVLRNRTEELMDQYINK